MTRTRIMQTYLLFLMQVIRVKDLIGGKPLNLPPLTSASVYTKDETKLW